MPSNSNGHKAGAGDKRAEVRLRARSVSRGIAIGKIVCLFGNDRQYYRISLTENDVVAEIRRLRAAVRLSARQLKKLSDADRSKHSPAGHEIFETHRMILSDASLISKIENAITEKLINAEWAVKLVTDEYVAKFKQIDDEHFRERFIDLEDVAQRITNALGGGQRQKLRLEKDAIIAAKELRPSTMVELYEGEPIGLITEHGGWTSHTFILAREVGIPAVTGLKKLLRRLNTGDRVIIDGFSGLVILHPTAETLSAYKNEVREKKSIPIIGPQDGPIKTLDGREIIIRANVDLPKAYKQFREQGVRGIGLYRSEFLFNRFGGFPTEHQQTDAYKKLAAAVGDDGVKIRTFDIGSAQVTERFEDRERNPALGLRAIRLSLAFPNQLRVQLRAILKASHDAAVDIVLPMVSSVSEIRDVKDILATEAARLEKNKVEIGKPGLGAMIEVPAAVLAIDSIFEETDFVCLGTNDLIQYLLAVDRDNETVANWYRTLHPAVLTSLKMVFDAAARANKPVIVCGEMAASPFYVPLLIGMGALELSMNLNSVARIRTLVSGIAYEEAKTLADQASRMSTAEEIEDAVREHISAKWSHLYPADFLDPKRA